MKTTHHINHHNIQRVANTAPLTPPL